MNLEIKDLIVETDNKKILDKFNLVIKPGEIHAIMGPNGVGKSTLSKVIMGYPEYKILKGDILVNSKSIKTLAINERSKLGIFLVYQNPISIEGVTTSEIIKSSLDNQGKSQGLYQYIVELEKNTDKLLFAKQMLHRSFNVGFSGGERKKNEILQVLMLKPKFIILDELDSGLDVDSLQIVSKVLNDYLKENPETSILIITHYTRILEYLKPNFVHMMKDGKIIQSGDYKLSKLIEKYGYNKSFTLEGNNDNE